MRNIGSVKEDLAIEKRISITPDIIKKFTNLKFSILLEKNYGEHLGINDEEYKSIGATFSKSAKEVLEKSEIILKVNCLYDNEVNIIKNKSIFTHVKLNIYPDGGVARIRIFGEMKINKKFGKKITNLTSVLNGATPIACNNEHFGRAENILAPGIGKNMGDGWETRRSRGKNFDWLILKCATAGKINKIQIDTHHFKGNYPDKCSVQAAYLNNRVSSKSIVKKSKNWKLLLNKVKLHAHRKHNFNNKLMKNKKINYIRINIYPDGGISRVRVLGRAE